MKPRTHRRQLAKLLSNPASIISMMHTFCLKLLHSCCRIISIPMFSKTQKGLSQGEKVLPYELNTHGKTVISYHSHYDKLANYAPMLYFQTVELKRQS